MSERKQNTTALNRWFEENPKLPQKIDPILLKRFFKVAGYDVESAKKLIENNYDVRNRNPKLFIERDPFDEEVEGYFQRFELCFLPGLTPDGFKLFFHKTNKFDPKEVNTELECRVFHMMADARLRKLDKQKSSAKSSESNKDKDDDGDGEDKDSDDDDDECISVGGITIFDVENITFSHFLRQSFSVTRVNSKYSQEAYPVHLESIHVINCPSFVDKMVSIMRPFLNDKVLNSMHFHTEGIESLFDFVPQEMLPCEYGGNAGTLEELRRNSKELLASQREYLMDEKYWRSENPPRTWSWW